MESLRDAPGGPRRFEGASAPWSRFLPRALAALLVVVLSGPGLAAAPEGCSLADGAPWHEYQSQHFIIDVAGWSRDPASLVGALEELHAVVLAAMVNVAVEIPGRVRVVLLPRHRDLHDYAGSTAVQGLFWVSPLGEPTILISSDQVDDLPQVVAHELAHHISSYLFPNQSFWFAEGLAQFVEGVAKVDGEGRRWAGGNPAQGWAAGSIKLPLMRGLVVGGEGELSTSLHLASWILYRFLWNDHGRQLATYQQQLMEGAEPMEAWAVAFPEWDVGNGKINNLNDAIARYQNAGRGLRWEVKVTAVNRAFSSRSPSLGDLHLSLLGLRLFHTNALIQDEVRQLALLEAEREDPGHPVVAEALARLRSEPALPVLRSVTARYPGDGRGWYLLGRETSDPAEREAALRKAVASWPDGALAQAALAVHLAGAGRPRAALPFANRAVELAPWSPTATAALATVALELSQCKQALTLQARAVAAVDSRRLGSLDGDATSLRAALATMRQRCARAKAAP